jgi:hypothetical protein
VVLVAEARRLLVCLGLLLVHLVLALLVVLVGLLVPICRAKRLCLGGLVIQHLLGLLGILVVLVGRVDQMGMVCMVVVCLARMVAVVVCRADLAYLGRRVYLGDPICPMDLVDLVGRAGSSQSTVRFHRCSHRRSQTDERYGCALLVVERLSGGSPQTRCLWLSPCRISSRDASAV